MNPDLPIGIFDSGVGGLTVYRALHEQLPQERFVYLGDTARVPYGTKSLATVERYAVENARFLEAHGVKLLVVAGNTASALAVRGVGAGAGDRAARGPAARGGARALPRSAWREVAGGGVQHGVGSGVAGDSRERARPRRRRD